MPPVLTITVLLAPASACVTARMSALRRASRSSIANAKLVSATAVIRFSGGGFS
jgi:hypothetical protein